MDPFQMIVAIVMVVTIGSIYRTKHLAKHGLVEDKKGDKKLLVPQDNTVQNEEIMALKKRVQILERIVTDNNKAIDLDREIESLRDK